MHKSYKHKNISINKGIVRSLICELFSGKGYKNKAVIEDEILQHHLDNGGKPPQIKLGTAITRVLSELENEGKAEKHGESVGYWQILPGADNDMRKSIPVQEDEIDIFEELRARDNRIEKLEKSLLLVLSLSVGNYADKSSQNFLSNIQTFALEQAEALVEEYGGTEKVIKNVLATTEERLRKQLSSFRG